GPGAAVLLLARERDYGAAAGGHDAGVQSGLGAGLEGKHRSTNRGVDGRYPPRGGRLQGARALSLSRERATQLGRDLLGRRLVDEDPADAVGALGLDRHFDVPMVIVPNRRPIALQDA